METASGDTDNYEHSSADIMYVTTNIPGVGINRDEFESEFTVGCSCTDSCGTICPCTRETVNYINNRINETKRTGLILECNSACTCPAGCGNRLIQRGPLDCLAVFETSNRGLGLLTNKSIRKNQFICEYAGEVIGIDEAKRRIEINKIEKKMNYILVVNEHCGDKVITTCIDPMYFGNIGRYCNHSCQPNANLVPVRIEGLFPHLCLFAVRDIEAGDEITFDYAGGLGKNFENFSDTRCLCGSSGCTGFLPHHPV